LCRLQKRKKRKSKVKKKKGPRCGGTDLKKKNLRGRRGKRRAGWGPGKREGEEKKDAGDGYNLCQAGLTLPSHPSLRKKGNVASLGGGGRKLTKEGRGEPETQEARGKAKKKWYKEGEGIVLLSKPTILQ